VLVGTPFDMELFVIWSSRNEMIFLCLQHSIPLRSLGIETRDIRPCFSALGEKAGRIGKYRKQGNGCT